VPGIDTARELLCDLIDHLKRITPVRYGCWRGCPRQLLVARVVHPEPMKSARPADAFLVEMLQAFLARAEERQVIIVEDTADGDQYVQFKRNNGLIYGEVGSREWTAAGREDRPLDEHAKARLAALRFTSGGRGHNYGCDDLAQSAPYLAELSLRLFEASYGVPMPIAVLIKSNVDSVQTAAGHRSSPLTDLPALSGENRHSTLQTNPVRTTPALRLRIERALRSNLAEVGTTTEELAAIRTAVEGATSWEALPVSVKEWVVKAEEGPLWVSLQPD
jgi:hypothetical protein